MSDNHQNIAPALLAFVAGALVGATAALILTPVSGPEMRGKLADLGETSADGVKRLAREARYQLSPQREYPDHTYDGGDAWI